MALGLLAVYIDLAGKKLDRTSELEARCPNMSCCAVYPIWPFHLTPICSTGQATPDGNGKGNAVPCHVMEAAIRPWINKQLISN